MCIPIIIEKIRTGVLLISFFEGTQKIASGSAFLCKNKIITNNHVFHPDGKNFAPNVRVTIKSGNSQFEFKYQELSEYVITGSLVSSNDYIVLDIKNEDFFKNKFQFELGNHKDVEIGEEILIDGFPFEHENLVSHIGHISAKYINSNINTIQLDASVNHGNSGGPLIDLKTLKAVGIITRKATGLTNAFDNLITSFDQNIIAVQKSMGSGMIINMGGVDLRQFMLITQNQMKIACLELKRSANVGIGYAFSCDKLKEEDFYNV